MSRVLVSPVAFNENIKLKNAIGRFLKSPAKTRADYLIVDDASTDGTKQMIQSFSQKGVATIRHQERQGVGCAIRTAIKHAQKNNYDVLVIMAGNDKDNPDEIGALIDPIINEGMDFVQGSRYLNKGGIGGDMPFYRKIATRLHPMLMGMFTGKKLTDTTNGFRAFRLSIFENENIDIDQKWLNHYELEPYILFKTIKCGFKYREAPVTKIYPSRKLGYTKMKPIVGWWSILKPVIYLGLGLKK